MEILCQYAPAPRWVLRINSSQPNNLLTAMTEREASRKALAENPALADLLRRKKLLAGKLQSTDTMDKAEPLNYSDFTRNREGELMLFLLLLSIVFGVFLTLVQTQRQLTMERGKRIHYELCTRSLVRAVHGTDPFFACPQCAAVTYSLGDIEHGWCGRCNAETRTPYKVALLDEAA